VSVTIRAATPKDARAIAEVHVSSWHWAYRDDLPASALEGRSVEDRELMWAEWFASHEPAADVLVAEEDGRIVGFSGFGVSRDDAAMEGTGEIRTIYLLRDAAGRGIGRDLFARANERLRDLGYRRATLWVLETNERSRRFYEKAGWTWDGTTSAHQFDCANLPIVRYASDL
jgi:L-amino acid N-acyltransferase YncA